MEVTCHSIMLTVAAWLVSLLLANRYFN